MTAAASASDHLCVLALGVPVLVAESVVLAAAPATLAWRGVPLVGWRGLPRQQVPLPQQKKGPCLIQR